MHCGVNSVCLHSIFVVCSVCTCHLIPLVVHGVLQWPRKNPFAFDWMEWRRDCAPHIVHVFNVYQIFVAHFFSSTYYYLFGNDGRVCFPIFRCVLRNELLGIVRRIYHVNIVNKINNLIIFGRRALSSISIKVKLALEMGWANRIKNESIEVAVTRHTINHQRNLRATELTYM